MPYLLLPNLSNPPFHPVATGVWEDKKGQAGTDLFLRGLADSLKGTKNTDKVVGIDSIPDVWARPLFFQMALFAPQNFDENLRSKAVGEWRALLAILALNNIRNLNLKAEHVSLGKSEDLGATLLKLAPKNNSVITHPTDISPWNDIYVITYKDKPLCITSPTTLLSPAADYTSDFAEDMKKGLKGPWKVADKPYLVDPLTNHMSTGDLDALRMWLSDLKAKLTGIINANATNKTMKDGLFALVDAYIIDAQKTSGGSAQPAGTLISAGFNIKIGIAKCLEETVQAPAVPIGAGGKSATLIKTSASRSDSKPLVLASPKMFQKIAHDHGLHDSDIIVCPGLTADLVDEASFSSDRGAIAGVNLGGATWMKPEEFFTDSMTVFTGSDVFKGILEVTGSDVMSQSGFSVILPLEAKILDYFTPEEIKKRISITKEGNDVKVRFSFPLSGMDGNGIDYTEEKSYLQKDIITIQTDAPVIDIWPNFKREGWSKYWLYYENNEAQNKDSLLGSDFLYVYPISYGKDIAGDTPSDGLANMYTSKLSGFPDALVCTVNRVSSDGINAVPTKAGLLLLKAPNSLNITAGKVWQIGVDFGTSSTMIYQRNAVDGSVPLVFNPNLFEVTKQELTDLQTYRNFIPSQMEMHQPGSFLSIFQLLNDNALKGVNPLVRPLQDGNVFLLPDAEGDEATDFKNNTGKIDANLKWQGDQKGKLKVAAYIKQVCLQSLVEAAKDGADSVLWNFSYPTAFSAAQAMTFKTTCQRAVSEVMEDSGFAPNESNPEYWPESKAGAYYFGNLAAVGFAGGAICMDIGAGTTDVSVISGKPARIVYHTSFKFAGRSLFDPIYKHYDLFRPPLDVKQMNEEQKNAMIDADMRKHSVEYLEALTSKTGDSKIEKVLQTAQFAVAGIFYYVGGIIGALREKGIYQGDKLPRVYVGGNGSRIFPWICGGVFDAENPYMVVFRDMLAETSGLSDYKGYSLILSKTPKTEVACGMIGDTPPHHATFFDATKIATDLFGDDGLDPLIANSMFAGDKFVSEEKKHEKLTFISAYHISKGVDIDSADELAAFADKFNSKKHTIWGKKILIDTSVLTNTAFAVDNVFLNQTGLDPDDIFVEPIFILELKKFLETC